MMAPKLDKHHSTKKQRTTLKLSEKLEIIKKLEMGVSRSVLMSEYNIGSSTLYDIKHSKRKLLEFAMSSESNSTIANRKSLHKPKLEKLDKVLHEWFLLKRSQGMAISGPMIVSKAKDFKVQLGINTKCTFSDGWLTNFKKRHGIRKLDIIGEKESADMKAAKQCNVTFKQLIKNNNFADDQIYNANETELYWKCSPIKTLVNGTEKSASDFKQNKEQITVLAHANVSGQHDIEEWIAVDEYLEVTQSFSDQEIIDRVIKPEKVNDNSDDCDEDDNVPRKKISWAVAEKCMETVLLFMEHNPNFSAQEVMQAHMLQKTMINKKYACSKQGDIRKFFKKVISANSQECIPSTSRINCDDTTETEL